MNEIQRSILIQKVIALEKLLRNCTNNESRKILNKELKEIKIQLEKVNECQDILKK